MKNSDGGMGVGVVGPGNDKIDRKGYKMVMTGTILAYEIFYSFSMI